jgi:hypothetical protein
MPLIHTLRKTLYIPISDSSRISSESINNEIDREQHWLDALVTDLKTRSAAMRVIEMVLYGEVGALKGLLDALNMYHELLSKKADNDLAAVHVMWACQKFWEQGLDPKHLTIAHVRNRAKELWIETRRWSGESSQLPKSWRSAKSSAWSRLFKALDIRLKAAHSGRPPKLSSERN